MKHLKTINEMILDKNIYDEIHDILLELSDEGFKIYKDNDKDKPVFTIQIIRPKDYFKRIKFYDYLYDEVLSRLKEYLFDNQYYLFAIVPKEMGNGFKFEYSSEVKTGSSGLSVVNAVAIRKFEKTNESKNKFNLSKSVEYLKSMEIKKDLEDICLELQDRRFNVVVKDKQFYKLHFPKMKTMYSDFLVSINLKETRFRDLIPFDYSDISEEVERIKDFLGDKYKVEIKCSLAHEEEVDSMLGHGFVWAFTAPQKMKYSELKPDLKIGYAEIHITESKVKKFFKKFSSKFESVDNNEKEDELHLSQDIINNIKDICLELYDTGKYKIELIENWDVDDDVIPDMYEERDIYKIEYNEDFNFGHLAISNDNFKYSEISEIVERIEDYMNSEGYETKVTLLTEDNDEIKNIWSERAKNTDIFLAMISFKPV